MTFTALMQATNAAMPGTINAGRVSTIRGRRRAYRLRATSARSNAQRGAMDEATTAAHKGLSDDDANDTHRHGLMSYFIERRHTHSERYFLARQVYTA
jgi:hypothetical protein